MYHIRITTSNATVQGKLNHKIMSNNKNSLKNDRKIGNFIFRWEEKTRDGHSYLRIRTVSGSWQLRLRDDQECTMMWHKFLEDGSVDKPLKTWMEAMEMVVTAIGDDVFALQIAFARQFFIIRHYTKDDEQLQEKMNDFTSKVVQGTNKGWEELMGMYNVSISKEEDDKILEEERKMHIATDLDIEKNNNTEGGSDGKIV